MSKDNLIRTLRNKHLEDNPDCPYGDQPHFVPPSFGQVGFYACQPPEDARNHTRCRPPYDHEHEDHRLVLPDGCIEGHHPDLVSCELGVDWP